jgi:hypothetical protein
MPGSAAKCFRTDSNEFKASNDYINKKKAQTIYYSAHKQDISNIKLNKIGNEKYKGPIYLNNGGFLGAVGGYNIDNYDLKLNVAKGRAYSEMPCIISTDLSTNATTNVVLNNPNDLCVNSVSKCQMPNSTYELFEGPYLIKTTTNTYSSEKCPLNSQLQYTTFDPSNIQTQSFGKLANDDKLHNLNLNSKLPLTCQPQLPVTIFIGSLYFIDIQEELSSSKYTHIIPKLEVKEVIIGTNVTSIGTSAFNSCLNLKAVSMPETIQQIKTKAFQDCSNLISITIPNSVTNIESNAFKNCTLLTKINFINKTNGPSIHDISNTFDINEDRILTFNLCFNNILLVNQFTTIINGIFENTCQDVPAQTTHFKLLTSRQALIDISDDLVSTDYTSGTYNISKTDILSVDIGTNVTSLGYEVFYNCSNLKSLTIPNSVTSIDASACKQCINLSSITIPDSVTSIGEIAFAYCEAATSITIPNSITIINYATFADCKAVTSINIPSSITTIKKYGFINCSSLTTVIFDANSQLQELIDGCFSGTSLGLITIPKSVELIDGYVFANCDSLTSISFEEVSLLETIGTDAFLNCISLESITIPTSVTSIGDSAFKGCSSLASITFEDISNSQLTTIGEEAFNLGSNISNITLPPSLTSVDASFISNCSDLSYIEFLGTRPDLASRLASEDLSGDINPGVFSNLRTAGVDPSTNIIVSGTDPSWNKINSIDGYPMKHFFELLKNGASFKLRNDAGYLYMHDASHPNGSQYLFTSNEISGSVFKLEQPTNILNISGEITYALYDTLNNCYLRHNDFILRCSTLDQLNSYPRIDWAWSFGKVQYKNVFYGTHTVIRNYYSNPTIMYDSGGNIPKIYHSPTWIGNTLNPGLSDAQIDFYFELV